MTFIQPAAWFLGLLALDTQGAPADLLDQAQHVVELHTLPTPHVIHGAGLAGNRGRPGFPGPGLPQPVVPVDADPGRVVGQFNLPGPGPTW